MWIINGLFNGLIIGFVVFILVFFVLVEVTEVTNGDTYKATTISLVIGAIVIALCVIEGVRMQLSDVWVDFYDNNGQIVESYEIDDYSHSGFNDGVTFYLSDGRTMVRQECIYDIRVD